MNWATGDLANWGECLVEVVDTADNGTVTVEVIECEDGSRKTGSSYALDPDKLVPVLDPSEDDFDLGDD